jgi:hypothetical protein
MKTLVVLTTVFLFVCITPAFAQWDRQATVRVPFDFTVGTTLLFAGTYEISTRPLDNAILIKNIATGASVYTIEKNIILSRSDQRFEAAEPKLVFRQDWDQHVLHQILLAGDDHIHDLLHGRDVPELAQITH